MKKWKLFAVLGLCIAGVLTSCVEDGMEPNEVREGEEWEGKCGLQFTVESVVEKTAACCGVIREIDFSADFQAPLYIPEKIIIKEGNRYDSKGTYTVIKLELASHWWSPGYTSNFRSTSSITLPASIKEIGMFVFYDLTFDTLVIKAITPPECHYCSFDDCKIGRLIVPTASVKAYKTTWPWSDYAYCIQGGAENMPDE